MTEREWQTAQDPEPMLRFLSGKVAEEELRLFAVACCRRIWQLMIDKSSRKCVTMADTLRSRQGIGQCTGCSG